MNAIQSATARARLADSLWSEELSRAYGRNACDARYDARGIATDALKRLCNDKRVADYVAHCAWSESYGATPAAPPPLYR